MAAARRRREFKPTAEWQAVEDDHVLPPGLDISMDLATGRKLARLLPGEDPPSSAAANSAAAASYAAAEARARSPERDARAGAASQSHDDNDAATTITAAAAIAIAHGTRPAPAHSSCAAVAAAAAASSGPSSTPHATSALALTDSRTLDPSEPPALLVPPASTPAIVVAEEEATRQGTSLEQTDAKAESKGDGPAGPGDGPPLPPLAALVLTSSSSPSASFAATAAAAGLDSQKAASNLGGGGIGGSSGQKRRFSTVSRPTSIPSPTASSCCPPVCEELLAGTSPAPTPSVELVKTADTLRSTTGSVVAASAAPRVGNGESDGREGAGSAAANEAVQTAERRKVWRVFQATQEWQEVQEDQVLPPGLDISMDLATGRKLARLLPSSAATNNADSAATAAASDSADVAATSDAASSTPAVAKEPIPSAAACRTATFDATAAPVGHVSSAEANGEVPVVLLADYDYHLPSSRIALHPARPRGSARLLVCRPGGLARPACASVSSAGGAAAPAAERAPVAALSAAAAGSEMVGGGAGDVNGLRGWEIEDRRFDDAPALLPRNALLVLNDSKVIRARILCVKAKTGGQAEVMLLSPLWPSRDPTVALAAGVNRRHVWRAMVGGRNLAAGDRLVCRVLLPLQVAATDESGTEGQSPDAGGLRGNKAAQDGGGAGVRRKDLLLTMKIEEKNGSDASVLLSWKASDGKEDQLSLGQVLELAGKVPLPPYLKRPEALEDALEYQTLHASREGSVAAPTAGLHFTGKMLSRMGTERGATVARVTLHVGAGTFRPVEAEWAGGHEMHAERFSITLDHLRSLREAAAAGRPIVPVGTTAVRAIESLYWWGARLTLDPPRAALPSALAEAAAEIRVDQWDAFRLVRRAGGAGGLPSAEQALEMVERWAQDCGLEEELVGETRMMILPGYRFALVDMLFTNTHQPRSTLLLLVAALVGGRERLLAIYRHALDREYRFLSFGDCTLLAADREAALLPRRRSGA